MLACVAAMAICPLPLVQDEWVPQGKIESREIQTPRREGNTVVGTEFVHYEYRVSLKIVETDEIREDEGGTPLRCVQECQGKVHKRHSECTPGSCDKKCTKNHRRSMRGTYHPLRDNMADATRDSGRLARALGLPGGSDNWSSYVSSALRELKSDAERSRRVTMRHSDKACGVLLGWHGRKRFELHVKGDFQKIGYYMSGGTKTAIDEAAGSHEKKIAEAWIPQEDPIRTDEGYICHCSVSDNQAKLGDPPIAPSEVTPGRTPTYSGLGWRRPDGTIVIPTDKDVSIRTSGDGINYVNIEIENKTSEDLVCEAEPGTTAIPADSAYQIMLFMVRTWVTIPALGSATMRLDLDSGDGIAKAELKVRSACAEMKKRPPTESTRFTFRPSQDDVFLGLANKADRSRFRGPWDQARVWIYTDRATLSEVNEKVLPGIRAERYITELRAVEAAGVDLSGSEFKRCLEASLLDAASAPAEDVEWLVHTMAVSNPKGLVEGLAARRRAWLESGTPEQAKLGAVVLRTMIAEEVPEVRLVALQAIEGASPARRAGLVEAGLLDTLEFALYSKKSAEAAVAIRIVGQYRLEGLRSGVEYLAEHGAAPLKAEAAKALSALAGQS